MGFAAKVVAGIDARTREVLYAGLIALVLLFGMLAEPVDQLVWTVQSRLTAREASGQVVFVGASEDLADPGFPDRRRLLARSLNRLAETDVERVYLDVIFARRSDPAVDAELHAAMKGLGERLYLVQSYETGLDGEDRLHRSLPELRDGVRQVGKSNYINFLRYVWDAPYTMAQHDSPVISLPVSIAGEAPPPGKTTFPINYGFALSSIPMLDLEDDVAAPTADGLRQTVAGRVVLIGNADQAARSIVDVPGHTYVPSSMVQVYAAETLKAGLTRHIGGLAILALCVLAVGLSLTARLRPLATVILPGVALALPALVLIASPLGVRVDVAASAAFVLLYALFKAKRGWRHRLELTDPATGLPTFAALEASKSAARDHPAIIVGKIHRLEDVKLTLPDELHSEYVNRIVERLRLQAESQVFYIGHGHCLAWCFPERDPQLIRDHLEGLRALLSAPMQVGTELVDASMTFSVDTSPSPNVARRLAAAVAAVEQTTEAHNPITTTEIENQEDLLWNISLQARIDAALENGEIYLLYQPKVLIETGDVVGVEALVRWNDPARGVIPPDVFIRQCESAGRMMHLTRHVLREACRTGRDFEGRGRSLPMAVNISATTLHNWEIVAAVREVLEETGFDPTLLTLEVTETYRILSLQTAHEVLAEISALGPKISMDDFGVGAASFEALLALPFSELKIDRLFVSKIADNAKAREIVRHVLQLGKDLHIIVVAEGIEDGAILAILRKLGCVVGQGFGIAPPMPASEVLEFQEGQSRRALQT